MAKKTSRPASKATDLTDLDQEFWSDFSRRTWEKKSLLLKNVNSPLLQMDEAEIFDLLLQYSDHCRKQKDPEGFKFYIDGVKVYADDVLQVLPVKKDKTLSGYHRRMASEFSDYCLVCDELLKTNLKKQDLLTDFTSELYRHVGFPNRFSEMGLYLGNYRKTPFGVHVDSCGVFSFPVVGQKAFRLWTSDFVKKNPALDRSFEYEKFKKHSELMVLKPGDMAYWPSSAWHIAESDGSFSATWSLGVWVDRPHHQDFAQALNGLLETKLGAPGQAKTTPFKKLSSASGEVRDLPAAFSRSLQQLTKLNPTELHEALLKFWMVHISLQGFKNIPQASFRLEPKTKIRLRSIRSPILWQSGKVSRSQVFVCFGGIWIECEKSSGIPALVKDLNAGKSCAVKDYLVGKTKSQDLKSLQLLGNAGAFA